MADGPDVLYEVENRIATITLNRPERLNAMGGDVLPLALEHVEDAAADDSVKVVILTGAGRGFCAGGDLSGPAGGFPTRPRPVESHVAALRHLMRSSQLLYEMPKISIAAINGPCAGAGLAWACACDLRYAAASARFSTAFVTAGLSGDFGGSWLLPRIVGSGKARELYLLGDRFDAAQAERIGLVAQVLPDEQLLDHVRQVATRLVDSAPLALVGIKRNLNDAEQLAFAQHLDVEADRHARCGASRDAREAARAFLEKRRPRFEGR